MASVSSTSSLGNTSLRGYGGMASGIDRDEIIEQMTLGTTTKINNQESAITKLEWKQEAYRSISDKILNMSDSYFSYSSSNSLKDPNTFAKSLISVLGKEDSTRFVTASGISELVGNISIQSVRHLASASVQMSAKQSQAALTMTMKDLGGRAASYSNLMGAELRFCDQNGNSIGSSFKFDTSYTETNADGTTTTKNVDYFPKDHEGYKALADDLNKMLEKSEIKFGDKKISEAIEFVYDYTKDETGNETGTKTMQIRVKDSAANAYFIQSNSTALKGLGYTGKTGGVESIKFNDYNSKLGLFENSVTTRINTIEYLKNKKLTFNYDGSSKDIVLITDAEAKDLLNMELDDEKLKGILGFADTDEGNKAYEALKEGILQDIRAEETEGAAADAEAKIKSDILKGLSEADGDFTKWLREKVLAENGSLTDDDKIKEAMDNMLAEKGADSLLQEMLVGEAEAPDDPGKGHTQYTEDKAVEDLERTFREQAEKELEGKDFATDADRENEIERIINAKFGDETQKANLIKAKQAEYALNERVEAEKNRETSETFEDGTFKTVFDVEKEKALGDRVAKRLQEESMTARLTKQATQEQQDQIASELNTARLQKIEENVQKRLDQAFGTDMVQVDVDGNNLTFQTKKEGSSVSVSSNDGSVLYTLGISNGESNKVNMSGNLSQSALKGLNIGADDYSKGLVINGVKIDGINERTSISSILSKINSSDAGVKATYVSSTGQFMLVSNETGEGREINLGEGLAEKLFGGSEADGASFVGGQNAQIEVSYGNGQTVSIGRGSNTFNLEGMEVTVSGIFGGEYVEQQAKNEDGTLKVDEKGNAVMEEVWKPDSSAGVSFSAKADVDKITESVKKFFEEFNAIATEVNTQVTTRPDSSYGPLTDEQKEEMNETSIENWEKKAKSGLLFNDSTMRSLSMDIQSVYTKLMRQTGLSYEDLKEMGITYSDNAKDGGTIAFDEAAFRSAVENKSDKVSALFTGGSGMGNGLVKIVEDTFTPYATRYASRNGNSYGRLIEEAGSEKIPTSIMKNQIYNEIKNKQDLIEQLRSKLKTEQDRYISMFTTMETMINKMNSQASYLSQITG